MGRILFTVLTLIYVANLSAKHVLVKTSKTWQDAQQHCRSQYTDLSPISNAQENRVFRGFYWLRWPNLDGWVGLYHNPDSPSEWTWSGGANATRIDFTDFLPGTGEYIHWNRDGLHGDGHHSYYFFCFNLMVEDVKRTWEEALEHCREVHTDLTSLHSETEQRLALSEMQYDYISEQVWIGLRYLGDGWLWVDGDPLVYVSWSKEGDQDHQCPMLKRCGALTKKGHWENMDCEEKLNFICY